MCVELAFSKFVDCRGGEMGFVVDGLGLASGLAGGFFDFGGGWELGRGMGEGGKGENMEQRG